MEMCKYWQQEECSTVTRGSIDRSAGIARFRVLEVLGYVTPRTWVPVANPRRVRRVPLRPGFTAADLRRHSRL